jgi:8-oxo-dGTP pyrophosphatase MutT (NUDIX family)
MTRERFRLPVAVHLLFVRDQEVLLLRRANTGYEDGKYGVPAGHLDGGEPVTSAAIREAREETGIELAAGDMAVSSVMHRLAGHEERIDFFLTVRQWAGEPRNCEPAKCDDLSWHRLDGLPRNMVPYVRRGLEAYVAGEPFVEFGWD